MKIVTLDYKKCGANALALIRSIGPQNTMIVGTEKKFSQRTFVLESVSDAN